MSLWRIWIVRYSRTLAQNLALLLLHDRSRAVVRIDDLVADVEQEGLPGLGVRRLHESAVCPASRQKCRQRPCRRPSHIIAGFSRVLNGTATGAATRRPPRPALQSCFSAARSVSRLRIADGARSAPPAGATTSSMPSFAHSSSRRSVWAACRRRPVRPISRTPRVPRTRGRPARPRRSRARRRDPLRAPRCARRRRR